MSIGSMSLRRLAWSFSGVLRSNGRSHCRRSLFTETGTVLPEPEKKRFRFLKVILVFTPGVYVGAALAKAGAAILEENDIFVPDDDEDD